MDKEGLLWLTDLNEVTKEEVNVCMWHHSRLINIYNRNSWYAIRWEVNTFLLKYFHHIKYLDRNVLFTTELLAGSRNHTVYFSRFHYPVCAPFPTLIKYISVCFKHTICFTFQIDWIHWIHYCCYFFRFFFVF